MALLGLGILLFSVSFLCYRHPPSSWSFLEWLRRRSIQNVARKQQGHAPAATNHDRQSESKEKVPEITMNEPPAVDKAELDRKAMPPPPPPFKKRTPKSPSPPTTPRASTAPTFTFGDSTSDGQEDEEPSAPSFPALNSVQRASGGTRGPPRLNAVPTQPSTTAGSMAPPSRTAGLMAPPARGPLPNRKPSTPSTSSLALPPTHSSIPTKPRKKVLLTPGHSPLDWARLTQSSPTLNGLPPGTPYLRVPPSLLKQYTGRKGKDAWTVLGGKVYNITPYIPYHSGGEPELMKSAGRDGTKLFGEVHPWVNWEGMLEGCLVGIAVDEGEVRGSGGMEEMD